MSLPNVVTGNVCTYPKFVEKSVNISDPSVKPEDCTSTYLEHQGVQPIFSIVVALVFGCGVILYTIRLIQIYQWRKTILSQNKKSIRTLVMINSASLGVCIFTILESIDPFGGGGVLPVAAWLYFNRLTLFCLLVMLFVVTNFFIAAAAMSSKQPFGFTDFETKCIFFSYFVATIGFGSLSLIPNHYLTFDLCKRFSLSFISGYMYIRSAIKVRGMVKFLKGQNRENSNKVVAQIMKKFLGFTCGYFFILGFTLAFSIIGLTNFLKRGGALFITSPNIVNIDLIAFLIIELICLGFTLNFVSVKNVIKAAKSAHSHSDQKDKTTSTAPGNKFLPSLFQKASIESLSSLKVVTAKFSSSLEKFQQVQDEQ